MTKAKARAAEKAVAFATDAFGGLHVHVNNAGFGFIGAIEEAPPDEYRPMFETNIIGLLETTRPAVLRKRPHCEHVVRRGHQGLARLGDYVG